MLVTVTDTRLPADIRLVRSLPGNLAINCEVPYTRHHPLCSSLHSGLWAGLSWQAGLQTGSPQAEQGRKGGASGARQAGQTGPVCREGPVRAAISTSTVSRGRISRVASRPRPRPATSDTRNGRQRDWGRWTRWCCWLQWGHTPHQVQSPTAGSEHRKQLGAAGAWSVVSGKPLPALLVSRAWPCPPPFSRSQPGTAAHDSRLVRCRARAAALDPAWSPQLTRASTMYF